MSAGLHRYRQFARRALIQAASTAAPTPPELAAAFQSLRDRLAHTLGGVFGPPAIDALFERARSLTADEFPWIADIESIGRRDEVVDGSIWRAHSADVVADGLAALLAHDIELLVGLVGDDLILPLIQKAWGGAMSLPSIDGESE
jgi:hypothetical protein